MSFCRGICKALVHVLCRVFFQMQTRDTNSFFCAANFNLKVSVRCQWEFVLRNLIPFGQVRIKIILPRETRVLVHGTIQRESGLHGQLDSALVQYWKRAGKTETNRASIRIRRVPKTRGTTAKNLRSCQQLRVDFQSNHRLVLGNDFGWNLAHGSTFGAHILTIIAPAVVRFRSAATGSCTPLLHSARSWSNWRECY